MGNVEMRKILVLQRELVAKQYELIKGIKHRCSQTELANVHKEIQAIREQLRMVRESGFSLNTKDSSSYN